MTPRAERALRWSADMIERSLAFARAAKGECRPVVGITCEFTPREIIMAAGGVAVSLCGGSAATIPAAEKDLPANLCPLVKSTYGYSVRGTNPFLEMADLLVVETTCDAKKKMYEWLARTRPVHVIELPQKPDDPDAFAHWLRELVKLRERLEALTGAAITDAKLRDAARALNRERDLRRRIAALMRAKDPPLTGREILGMKSLVSCMPADHEMHEAVLAEIAGRTVPGGRRARVLLTGVPMPHGAERVMDIIEACGGLVVAQENCTGLKPILDDVDPDAADPLRAIAEKYFHLPCPVMTPDARRFDLLRRLAAEYAPHCVIEVIWQACTTYDVESGMVRELVEGALGLPYMRIETDYSPSDTGRIETRVQALFESIAVPGAT